MAVIALTVVQIRGSRSGGQPWGSPVGWGRCHQFLSVPTPPWRTGDVPVCLHAHHVNPKHVQAQRCSKTTTSLCGGEGERANTLQKIKHSCPFWPLSPGRDRPHVAVPQGLPGSGLAPGPAPAACGTNSPGLGRWLPPGRGGLALLGASPAETATTATRELGRWSTGGRQDNCISWLLLQPAEPPICIALQ